MNLVKEKWDDIIQKLKIEYDVYDVSFKTWILPLKIHDVKDSFSILLGNSNSVTSDLVVKRRKGREKQKKKKWNN